MALNMEFKAKVKDMDALLVRIGQLTKEKPEVIEQEDIFFRVHRGRLKMRCDPSGNCYLIYYHRPNESGPKVSAYFTEPVHDPKSKRDELARLFGEGPVIHKSRLVYDLDGSRLQIDQVEGLGSFLEIEIPLPSREAAHRAKVKALDLMKALGLSESDLQAEAYAELPRGLP